MAGPLLLYKALRRGKYHQSAPAMFGKQLHMENPGQWRRGCVWVHAVSVGEVVAARAILPLLREKFQTLPILLTTVTETGQAQANSLPAGLTDAVRYYPVDFSWIVRKFASVYKPRVFIPMETELWPNALRIFADYGASIFVLNGKISDNSYRNYSRLAWAFRGPLSGVSAFCMQTHIDAERMGVLCGSPDKVFVTGNCKFDVPAAEVSESLKEELRRLCGVNPGDQVIVAGSTHPGEEEIVLDAFRKVSGRHPQALLLLAPRHPERFAHVWEIVRGFGLSAQRLSDRTSCDGGGGAPRVILIDRMGILSRLYAVAQMAVVAGSFVEGIGGHNILEAAAHGVPVIYGPHMEKQPDMARLLDEKNGGTAVQADGLAECLCALLSEPALAAEKGERGRQAVMQNQGAARKNIEIISRFL